MVLTELLDKTTHIAASKRNFEPAIGVELMPEGTHGWRPYASYEGRLRTIYDYNKVSTDDKERAQFSSTLVLGIRDLSHPGPGIPDFIVKGYYGVNPNGQFRNQKDYWMIGFGLYVRI